MTAIQTGALLILTVFYASFFIKAIMMKRRGIDSNLLGKGQKPEKARRVEQRLKAVTYAGATLQFAGLFLAGKIWGLTAFRPPQYLGLLLAAGGCAFFIAAMRAMKNNWRSGCAKGQNSSLVVSGPYKISRNPAFVGFDLLYIGYTFIFPNILSLTLLVLAVVTFHQQILEEEGFLEKTFGQEYRQYKAKVQRYLGLRRPR